MDPSPRMDWAPSTIDANIIRQFCPWDFLQFASSSSLHWFWLPQWASCLLPQSNDLSLLHCCQSYSAASDIWSGLFCTNADSAFDVWSGSAESLRNCADQLFLRSVRFWLVAPPDVLFQLPCFHHARHFLGYHCLFDQHHADHIQTFEDSTRVTAGCHYLTLWSHSPWSVAPWSALHLGNTLEEDFARPYWSSWHRSLALIQFLAVGALLSLSLSERFDQIRLLHQLLVHFAGHTDWVQPYRSASSKAWDFSYCSCLIPIDLLFCHRLRLQIVTCYSRCCTLRWPSSTCYDYHCSRPDN